MKEVPLCRLFRWLTPSRVAGFFWTHSLGCCCCINSSAATTAAQASIAAVTSTPLSPGPHASS
ncbi:hypothetical protein U0070_008040, partial [Myodes glareolus]